VARDLRTLAYEYRIDDECAVSPASEYIHPTGSRSSYPATPARTYSLPMSIRDDDITLELETIRLVINPRVGASIVALHHRDALGRWAPVMREMPADSTDPSDAGSFLMLPWTNRVKNASFTFADRTYPLTANHSDGTAIHGIGRDRAWSITDRSPISARLTLDARGDSGSPYDFGGVVRYEIGPQRVDIDLSVTNLGTDPIPVGCGHHPYFHRHLHSDADQLRLRMGVAGRYVCDDCIPSGEVQDDEVCAALRAGGPVGNPGLDDVFTGFEGTAELEWPESNTRLTMRCSDALGHVVIYTPKDPDGSPNAFVCVEPVSMVNDGFNLMQRGHTDTGTVTLQPGETLRTRTALIFSTIN
jgi:aldose 1-epimerase